MGRAFDAFVMLGVVIDPPTPVNLTVRGRPFSSLAEFVTVNELLNWKTEVVGRWLRMRPLVVSFVVPFVLAVTLTAPRRVT